jgi:acetolactate synthase-1/3 small subunit
VRQILKQIEKITEVISASELDVDQSFWREVAIVKLEDRCRLAWPILEKDYHLEILDRHNDERFIVQVAGTSQVDRQLHSGRGRCDSIVEVARSGIYGPGKVKDRTQARGRGSKPFLRPTMIDMFNIQGRHE